MEHLTGACAHAGAGQFSFDFNSITHGALYRAWLEAEYAIGVMSQQAIEDHGAIDQTLQSQTNVMEALASHQAASMVDICFKLVLWACDDLDDVRDTGSMTRAQTIAYSALRDLAREAGVDLNALFDDIYSKFGMDVADKCVA